MRVRVSNDLIHWVRFFLNGVAQTATKGRDTFQQILALRSRAEQQVLELGKRAPNARQALNVLCRKPMLMATALEQALGLSHPTVNALLQDFIRLGILREVTGAARNRLYVFEAYLDLFLK
jgi:Fic family protein